MFVTVEQFCKITGLGDKFVRQLCKSADFPVMMVGRKYMIDREAAIKFLKDKAAYREYIKTRNRVA